MRFNCGEAKASPNFFTQLTKAAEENGHAGFTIPDRLIHPKQSDAKYSDIADGKVA